MNRRVGYEPARHCIEIDDYRAFDPITQHALIKFKFTHIAAFTHGEPCPQEILEDEYLDCSILRYNLEVQDLNLTLLSIIVLDNILKKLDAYLSQTTTPPNTPSMAILNRLKRKCTL